MDIINYNVSVNNISEIVIADSIVYVKKTGQTLFYANEKLIHIAPASAFISSTYDKTEVQNALNSLNEEINSIIRESNKTIEETGIKTLDDPNTRFQRGQLNVAKQILDKLENINRRFLNY